MNSTHRTPPATANDRPTLSLPRRHAGRAQDADRELHQALCSLASVTEPVRLGPAPLNRADPLLGAYRLVVDVPHLVVPPAGMTPVAQRIDEMARCSRHRARGVALRGRWWRQDHGPLLGFRKSGQPVALLPVSPSRYDLVDPADGTRQRITTQIACDIAPGAYSMTHPFADHPSRRRDLFLFGLRRCRRDILALLFAAVAMGLLGVAMPLAMGLVVDSLIPDARRNQLLFLAAGLIVAALATAAFRVVGNVAALRIECRMNNAAVAALWDRMLRLPAPFFRSYSAGDLALRAMGTVQVQQAAVAVVTSVAFLAVPALFDLVLLFFLDWRVALVALVLLLLVAGVSAVACRREFKYHTSILALEGALTGRVLETLTGITKIKAAGAESRAFARWAGQFAVQKRTTFRAHRVTTFTAVFGSAFPPLASLAIFAMFAHLMAPEASLGSFLSFNTAFGSVMAAALSLGVSARALVRVIPACERVMPVLRAVPEVGADVEAPGELTGEIQISHVSFRYDPTGPLVLDDLTLSIRPGEFVAVVGPSGSGKSTLLRTLLGLDRPQAGSISYDRRDLRTLDVSALRRQIGTVVQNGKLLPGSILDNIAGSLPLSPDEAWRLAERVGLDRHIRAMPMGLHTYVNDGGSTLSGGQRQQLMLARALAGNPRVLLFDEATSALDNTAQALVSRGLEQLAVTRVVIAHRLSTIHDADRIVVLDAGRIVQVGRYQELAGRPGLFADLIARQLV